MEAELNGSTSLCFKAAMLEKLQHVSQISSRENKSRDRMNQLQMVDWEEAVHVWTTCHNKDIQFSLTSEKNLQTLFYRSE